MKLYAFGGESTEVCKLRLPLPDDDAPWVVLLKASCMEGNGSASEELWDEDDDSDNGKLIEEFFFDIGYAHQ